MGKGLGSGASLIAIGMIARKFVPAISNMQIDTEVFGNISIGNLFIYLGLFAIGAEVFNMMR